MPQNIFKTYSTDRNQVIIDKYGILKDFGAQLLVSSVYFKIVNLRLKKSDGVDAVQPFSIIRHNLWVAHYVVLLRMTVLSRGLLTPFNSKYVSK